MLNPNVATRFDRDDTIGATPADLALVGQNVAFGVPNAIDNYNTGLLDNPANTETYQVWATNPYGTTDQRWLPGRWGGDFLPEIGIFSGSGFFLNADNRLAYWQLGGRQPFSATAGITPFALSDELELRMYHGQNAPFVLSRFERALNTTGTDYAILRSPISREESSEYRDQLGNRELRYDLRHDLTLFNGARNEEMPPWLWWRWDAPNLPQVELANFFAQSRRKLDLRETNPANLTLAPGTRTLRERLPETLALALSDGPSNPSLPAYAGQSFGSYYGPYDSSNFATPDSDFQNTLRLSAAVTANLLAYRSASSEAFVVDDPTTIDIEGAVEVPRIGPTFGSTANVSKFLGMEKQPFLLEAFVAHVYKGEIIPEPYEDQGGMAVHQDSPRSTIAVVQIANPFDEAIDLDDYELSLFGQTADLATVGGGGLVLPPATSSAPRTAIFYAIDSVLETDNLLAQWVDFLDLDSADHPVGTIIVDVNVGLGGLGGTSVWSTDRDEYDAGSGPGVGGAPAGDPTGPAIVLRRKHPAGVTGPSVVVDRIDPPDDSDRDFGDAVNEMKDTEPPKKNPIDHIDPTATGPFGGIVIAPDEDLDGMPDDPYTYWSQWVRVTRAWAADLNGRNGYEPNEQNPRYVFANRAVVKPTQPTTPNERFAASGVRFEFGIDPDGGTGANTWFERTYHRIIDVGGSPSDELVVRKPTFFDMNPDSGLANFPDKGWYGQPQGADDETVDPGSGALRVDQPYPLQMLQKNGDFQQVGELLNVWLYGHELRFVQGATGNYDSLDATGDDEGTVKTFSEFMIDNALVGEDGRVNRLRVLPQGAVNPVIGVADPTILRDLRHAFPDLPAGIRVLDAFVCDGPGFNPPANPAFDARYDNAQGFSGVATPGLVNISTAPLEVLRTMPQMWKLVHEVNAPIANPRIALPEAMIQYRERFSTNAMRTLSAPIGGPDYSARSAVTDDPNLRVSRGFASPNEVLLLDKPAPADVFQTTGEIVRPDAWRAITAASGGWFVDPNNSDVVESTRVSNDVQDVRNYDTGNFDPDLVAGDVEEANLLHAGISNLITTRSDLFTVYFKVRSFRQREDGRWNALDRDQIVDDSRYVMLVDRSAVNSPSDPPRILYFEKLPN